MPAFPLQAAAVYRLEVGGACFAAFYLAAMALVPALDGRGFAEPGTRGLRAAEVVRATDKQKVSLDRQAKFSQKTEKDLARIRSTLEKVNQGLNSHEQRLEALERGR